LEFGNDELHVFYTQGIRSNYLAIHHAFQPSRHQFVGMVTTNLLWETVLFAEFFYAGSHRGRGEKVQRSSEEVIN
jgi:hypothetical protein